MMTFTTRLAIVGLAIGVVALAFTVRPVRASTPVFSILLALGAGTGLAGLFTPALRRKPAVRDADPRSVLAGECRRLEAALGRLVTERESHRPKRIQKNDRIERWRAETAKRYRVDYRVRALRVYWEAVELGAAPKTAVGLVESPSGDQIPDVQNLFGEIARRLES